MKKISTKNSARETTRRTASITTISSSTATVLSRAVMGSTLRTRMFSALALIRKYQQITRVLPIIKAS